MTQALIARARSFPGQEKQVWDFYRNNNQALAELRAPIYEEKVVDHILGLARVEERKVSKEELMKPVDDERRAGRSQLGGAAGRDGAVVRLTRGALRRRASAEPFQCSWPPFSGRRRAPMLKFGVRRHDFRENKDRCAIRSTITTTTSCRS